MTLATNVWDKLNECYEEKGYNTVAYLIKEIFHVSFSDEMPIEPQLNNFCHKTYILKMFSEPISNAVLITTSSLSPFILLIL